MSGASVVDCKIDPTRRCGPADPSADVIRFLTLVAVVGRNSTGRPEKKRALIWTPCFGCPQKNCPFFYFLFNGKKLHLRKTDVLKSRARHTTTGFLLTRRMCSCSCDAVQI
jgi:hypothetical protein